MILPQPWSEIGQTNEEIERALYAEVAASLRPQGYQVVIKPHPRERPGKYATLTAAAGIEVWTQPVPVETLFADLRSGDLVLGHNTTSLLTAAALSPATPRTLGDLLIDRAGAGEIFANFQSHFRRLAGHTVSDGRDLLRRQAA